MCEYDGRCTEQVYVIPPIEVDLVLNNNSVMYKKGMGNLRT